MGRFPIRGLLGEGGFGRVYRAYDPDLQREVALKVPLPGSIVTAPRRERFLLEARAAAGLTHANICPVYEIGKVGDEIFIVMAYIAGQSLAEFLQQRDEPLPERQGALIVRKLALAVHVPHSKGIVHRDLKPGNILLDRERNEPVITDFGLVRLMDDERDNDPTVTQQGRILGTPSYMAPEQAAGQQKRIGPHSDLYALGVILFELLTGECPFRGSAMQLVGMHLNAARIPPSQLRPAIDPRLDAIVLKAMAIRPEDRFESGPALARALEDYLRPTAPETTARKSESLDIAAFPLTTPAEWDVELVEPDKDTRSGMWRKSRWPAAGLALACVATVLITSVRPRGKPAVAVNDAASTQAHVAPAIPSSAALAIAPVANGDNDPLTLPPKTPGVADYSHIPADCANRAQIVALEDRIAALNGKFDYTVHNGLRHEYGVAGSDRVHYHSDVILRNMVMNKYIISTYGNHQDDNAAAGNLLFAMERYRKFPFVSMACRIRAAELTRDEYQAKQLLKTVVESTDPAFAGYRAYLQNPDKSDDVNLQPVPTAAESASERSALARVFAAGGIVTATSPTGAYRTVRNASDLPERWRITGFRFNTRLTLTDKELAGILAATTRLKSLILSLTQVENATDIAFAGLATLPLEEFTISTNYKKFAVTDKTALQLSKIPSLRSVTIGHSDITADGMARIASQGKLTRLMWTGDEWPVSLFTEIGRNDNLLSLSVQTATVNNRVDKGGLSSLARLKMLKNLTLQRIGFSDRDLEFAKELPSLESLTILSNGVGFTGEGFRHVAELPRLARISSGWSSLTDACAEPIGRMPALENLNLCDDAVSSAGILQIAKSKSLTTVSMMPMIGSPSRTDDDLVALAGMPQLQNLNFANNSLVGDRGVAALEKHPALEVLNLSRTKITGNSLDIIATIPNLKTLIMTKCDIQDVDLAKLTACKSLKILVIKDTAVTDNGMAQFTRLLPECKITKTDSTPQRPTNGTAPAAAK